MELGNAAVDSWFLSRAERGNDATRLDDAHAPLAWTPGCEVRPLIHGAAYYAELHERIDRMHRGDLLLFTDWRGDPDELLDGPGSEVATVLCGAAERGVLVRGLVWRSHLDRFAFSEQENRHLGQDVVRAGGLVLRDMRVRPGGSHHQKFVVLRHPDRPELDCAFVGGIDLCHSRRDDARHLGDPQRQPMAKVYGPRPPWHDIQALVRGPAVHDLETVFRERWDDPTPLNRNPFSRLGDRMRGERLDATPLPPQQPPPEVAGTQHVQVLRTYPPKRPAFPFAPHGEQSVRAGYEKVLGVASRLVYIEDQYFWNTRIVRGFVDALRRSPELRLIVVLPRFPDQDGRMSEPPNQIGRWQALRAVYAAGGSRVGVFGVENHDGVPVYVHAKLGIVDDVWASVGSANVNRRSWTHDSELTCAVIDETRDERAPAVLDRLGAGARRFARELRLDLAAEHLDRPRDDVDDLCDPVAAFDAFTRSAAALEEWHRDGRRAARPPGRLRPYRMPELSKRTRTWATPLYRVVYDPTARPRVRSHG